MFKKIVSFLAVPALMAVSGATFAAEGAAGAAATRKHAQGAQIGRAHV